MVSERERMTFDELTSAYRIESKTAAAAEVRKDLYPALAELSERIRREYESELAKDPGSIICEGINERRKKINLYSHKIVDQRMDKITRLAIGGAMGADNSIDNLTPEERDYYQSVLDLSRKHRALIDRKGAPKATVLNVEPASEDEPPAIVVEKVPEPEIRPEREMAEDGITETETTAEPAEMDDEQGSVTIRILEDLPVFSGPDIDYDLRKEDVIRMPAVMANALIGRDKAVKVDLTP